MAAMTHTTLVLPENPHWIERLTRQVTDPRVLDWPMLGSPAWPLTVVAAYMYFVLSYGPEVMKARSPFSLKRFLSFYNVFQVVANSVMFHTVLTSGWTTSYSLGCQNVDRSQSAEAMRMAKAMWWWFLIKKCELIETVLFVLRKKHRQISFLHVYHHVSTYLVAWIAAKFSPGGLASFAVLPNSFVHILMYSYYLLTTINSPLLQNKLATFKKYITTIQLVQLTIIGLHASQALLPTCTPTPKILAYFFSFNVILVISLFLNFYIRNYVRGSLPAGDTATTMKKASEAHSQ